MQGLLALPSHLTRAQLRSTDLRIAEVASAPPNAIRTVSLCGAWSVAVAVPSTIVFLVVVGFLCLWLVVFPLAATAMTLPPLSVSFTDSASVAAHIAPVVPAQLTEKRTRVPETIVGPICSVPDPPPADSAQTPDRAGPLVSADPLVPPDPLAPADPPPALGGVNPAGGVRHYPV